MQQEEIVTLLSLVGEELQACGLQRPVRVPLIGGAYMLTQVHNRSTTRDVDVIVLELPTESEGYRRSSRPPRWWHRTRGSAWPG